MEYICSDKDIRKTVNNLIREGKLSLASSKGGHSKLRSPDGTVIVVSKTPSDWRARKKIFSDLRKVCACLA